MIEIAIDPTLLRFGPIQVTWHGLFTAVAVVVGIWLAERLGQRRGFSEDDILSVALWAVIGGIVGARLVHVIDQWPYYAANPLLILAVNEGGLAIFGVIIGGPLAVGLYSWRRGLSIPRLLDIGASPLILGMAIGRVGDIINGEHHGVPADVPWAFVYTHPNTLGQIGVPVHPAVAYELIWDLVVFGVVIWLFGRGVRTGVPFWTMVGAYSVGRFVISNFRLDTIVMLGMSQAQLIAVASTLLSIWVLTYLLVRPRRTVADRDAAAPPPAPAEEPAKR